MNFIYCSRLPTHAISPSKYTCVSNLHSTFGIYSMQEKTDFDQKITRSLTEIVSSLTDYLNTKNTNPVEPKPPRIKKTPEMTYHQFLQKALASKKPIQMTEKKQSYRMQEDLQLLLQLASYGTISSKCFEEIHAKKRLKRAFESIKSRYSDYLSKIGEGEMKKIVSWIEREGVEGYISFDGNQLRISLTDPKESKKAEEMIEENNEVRKEDYKRLRPASLQTAQKKSEKKDVSKQVIPTNSKQLNDIMKLYSKMVNIPIKTLLIYLDKVSGDFVQLDNYIETKDDRLLWTAQEDQILRKGGAQVQLLKKYRGAAVVETRKKYLGITQRKVMDYVCQFLGIN